MPYPAGPLEGSSGEEKAVRKVCASLLLAVVVAFALVPVAFARAGGGEFGPPLDGPGAEALSLR